MTVLLLALLACQSEPSPEASPAAQQASPAAQQAAPAAQQASPAAQQPPPEAPARPPMQLPELELSPALEPAAALLLERKTAEARLLLEPWIEEHPADADALYLLGRSWIEEQSWPSAETAMRSAVAADPGHTAAHKALIGTLIGQRRCEDAFPIIEEFRTLHPDDGEAIYMRSYCHRETGDPAAAVADAQTACDMGYKSGCRVAGWLKNREEWMARKKAEAAAGKDAEDTP